MCHQNPTFIIENSEAYKWDGIEHQMWPQYQSFKTFTWMHQSKKWNLWLQLSSPITLAAPPLGHAACWHGMETGHIEKLWKVGNLFAVDHRVHPWMNEGHGLPKNVAAKRLTSGGNKSIGSKHYHYMIIHQLPKVPWAPQMLGDWRLIPASSINGRAEPHYAWRLTCFLTDGWQGLQFQSQNAVCPFFQTKHSRLGIPLLQNKQGLPFSCSHNWFFSKKMMGLIWWGQGPQLWINMVSLIDDFMSHLP